MRRMVFLFFVVAFLALPSPAQIGKQVVVRAGTPEDKALTEIDNTPDPAKKLELLDNFLAEFGQSDMAILAYERLATHYLGEKNYDKAFEYFEKILALDPDSFTAAFNLIRAAHEKADTSKLFDAGERAGAILQRYTALPPPAGVEPDVWEQRKTHTLEEIKGSINYIHYTLFEVAYQIQVPATKAALLERYVAAFPDSPYASNAQMLVTDAYQQGKNPAKMVEFAQKVLARQPENFWMLVVLADYWAVQRVELDRAEQYARKALGLLEPATKPPLVTDEEWLRQKTLQLGLAHSALGQVLVHKNRDAQAVDSLRSASPLLKAYPYYHGRNLFFLGFVLARMKRTAEARPILTEATAVDSPYRALAKETLAKIGGPVRPGKRRP